MTGACYCLEKGADAPAAKCSRNALIQPPIGDSHTGDRERFFGKLELQSISSIGTPKIPFSSELKRVGG